MANYEKKRGILYHNRIIAPTPEEVTRFCKLTGDNNRLHDNNYMRSKGARAYVPGMMIAGHALAISKGIPNPKLRIYFKKPLFIREEAVITRKGLKGLAHIAAKHNTEYTDHEELLALGRVIPGAISHNMKPTGRINEHLNLETIEELSGIIQSDKDTANIIYLASLTSKAGLEILRQQNEKRIPVYTKITITGKSMVGDKITIISSADTKRRNATLESLVFVDNLPACRVTSEASLVSERILIRMAKNKKK